MRPQRHHRRTRNAGLEHHDGSTVRCCRGKRWNTHWDALDWKRVHLSELSHDYLFGLPLNSICRLEGHIVLCESQQFAPHQGLRHGFDSHAVGVLTKRLPSTILVQYIWSERLLSRLLGRLDLCLQELFSLIRPLEFRQQSTHRACSSLGPPKLTASIVVLQ